MKKIIKQLEQKIVELEKALQALEQIIAGKDKIIAEQATEIEDLKKRLRMNSQNSSLPPSSDGFKKKPLSLDLFVKRACEQLGVN